ncbi:uncharacterized protein LOC107274874 [Cephus cinctus]|uniref:Uncharacterized protein LOC107274874 n=1 Tax=Cephus cinctus TaxID=211228 RepID=A0AAJ7R773_CEPCN|nr:uncharacterized protein LOC107274874 [Cephus cinctus]
MSSLLSVLTLVGFLGRIVGTDGYLVYPENTVLQHVIGISLPVFTTKRGGVASSIGFQLNFVLPYNVTQFEPVVIPARQARDLTLEDTYKSIETMLDEHGWHGRECLLRTICELAELPLERNRQDLFEEIIYLLLTPSEDLPEAVNSNHRAVNKLYQEAERLGMNPNLGRSSWLSP